MVILLFFVIFVIFCHFYHGVCILPLSMVACGVQDAMYLAALSAWSGPCLGRPVARQTLTGRLPPISAPMWLARARLWAPSRDVHCRTTHERRTVVLATWHLATRHHAAWDLATRDPIRSQWGFSWEATRHAADGCPAGPAPARAAHAILDPSRPSY